MVLNILQDSSSSGPEQDSNETVSDFSEETVQRVLQRWEFEELPTVKEATKKIQKWFRKVNIKKDRF